MNILGKCMGFARTRIIIITTIVIIIIIIKPLLKISDECRSLTVGGRIKHSLKILNECRSLTEVGELNPYWRSWMNVEIQQGWEN